VYHRPEDPTFGSKKGVWGKKKVQGEGSLGQAGDQSMVAGQVATTHKTKKASLRGVKCKDTCDYHLIKEAGGRAFPLTGFSHRRGRRDREGVPKDLQGGPDRASPLGRSLKKATRDAEDDRGKCPLVSRYPGKTNSPITGLLKGNWEVFSLNR